MPRFASIDGEVGEEKSRTRKINWPWRLVEVWNDQKKQLSK